MLTYKNIWKISLPIMFSMLAQNIISATDIAFISRYSDGFDASLAEGMTGAVGIGSIFYYCLFIVGFGFASGVQILVARRNGQKNYRQIGGILESGLLFLLLISVILIFGSLMLKSTILPKLIKSPDVIAYTADFLDIRIFGLIFAFVNVTFRSFHVGITDTKPVTYTSIFMAVNNVALNYVLVFGKFGFPEMGIKGAALASVIAEFSAAVFFIFINMKKPVRTKYRLFSFKRVSAATVKKIMKVSVYVMIQYTLSICTWLAFFLMIEKAGTIYLDSSQLVRTVYSLITIPGWAFAVTTSTLVSNAIGAQKAEEVSGIIMKMIKMSAMVCFLSVCFLFLFSKQILSVFSQNEKLIAISNDSVLIVVGAILVFSISTIPFNGIIGIGKTHITMIIEIIGLGFYLLSLYLFYDWFLNSPARFWYTEFIYWGSLAIMSYIYLYSGRWKKGIYNL